MIEEPLKIGIIGLGHYGRKRLSALLSLPQWKVSALYDLCPEVRERIRSEHHETIKESLSDFFKIKHDALLISTPNHTHFELCKLGLSQGLPILCEKPLSSSVGEISELEELEEQSLGRIQMGSNYSYFPAIKVIDGLLRKRELGDIKKIFITIGHSGFNENERWNLNKELSGGGTLIDNGIHALSFLCRHFRSFTIQKRVLNKVSRGAEHYARIEALADGALLVLESSWSKPFGYSEWFIEGSKKCLMSSIESDQVNLINKNGAREIIKGREGSSIHEELRAFHQAISCQEPFMTPPSQAARIIQMIYQ